jgi:hypothetical protein
MGVGKAISLIASYRFEMVKIERAAKLRAWRANFLLKLKSPYPPSVNPELLVKAI